MPNFKLLAGRVSISGMCVGNCHLQARLTTSTAFAESFNGCEGLRRSETPACRQIGVQNDTLLFIIILILNKLTEIILFCK